MFLKSIIKCKKEQSPQHDNNKTDGSAIEMTT